MLEIRDLDVRYGLFQALFGVSLEIERGATLALIGANGAGKTTLLRAIAGAIGVASGSISLQGHALQGGPETRQIERGIALVPEGRRLFAQLTVRENVQLAAHAARRAGRDSFWTPERLFDELPALKPLLPRPATALSGGQQQLVAIARGLALEPDYLLCDEVSLGLSPLAIDDVYALLAKVKRHGTGVVLVEQNVSRALSESDRFCCLQKGRAVLAGASALAHADDVADAYFGVQP
jgi:branched-chain amino acid transport system ATP-binding protein